MVDSHLKLDMTPEEAGELYDTMDLDGDGRLTRKEFTDKNMKAMGRTLSSFRKGVIKRMNSMSSPKSKAKGGDLGEVPEIALDDPEPTPATSEEAPVESPKGTKL